MLKPKTTIDEMIKLLKSKNIKFKLMIKKKIKKVLLQKNSNE
ncbi:unknown [Mycoplasma sp. CAG:472]|nr:unknown [Mycoplasma sp. CAG:472]